MKWILSITLLMAFPAFGLGEEWFQVTPEIKSSETLVEVVVKNPYEVQLACVGEASALTYFDDSQYTSLQLAVIHPNESVSLFLRSRYGDPIVSVWTSIFCKKLDL